MRNSICFILILFMISNTTVWAGEEDDLYYPSDIVLNKMLVQKYAAERWRKLMRPMLLLSTAWMYSAYGIPTKVTGSGNTTVIGTNNTVIRNKFRSE